MQEQKQLANIKGNYKNQNETSSEKINILEGQLSQKEDDMITLNHKLEIAEKVFNALLRIDYDFMKASKYKY